MIHLSMAKTAISAALLGGALLASASVHAQSAGPFANLQGAWRGQGQIRLEGGKSEKVECRAYYTGKGGGSALGIAIECAAADYKIRLRSSLTHVDGRLTGSWEEREFNASGNLTGKASGGNINLSIEGGGLTGTMKVQTEGSSQSINITTVGIPLKGVTMNLTRS